MSHTTVIIMGLELKIDYTIHDPSYVEWKLTRCTNGLVNYPKDYPVDEMELLNVLLRTHYSELIESMCREAHFYGEYAASAAYAENWADSLNYTDYAKNVFKKKKDIPF